MTMSTRAITVRPATDADDLDVINAGNFTWWSAEHERRIFASGPPEVPKAMLVAELDGVPVGYALGVGVPIAAYGYGIATVYVLPHARRKGVGRTLLDEVIAVVRRSGVPGVMASVSDGDTASLQAWTRWGFVDHGHHFESRLDLTVLSDSAVDRALAGAVGRGYVIESMPADASDADWRDLYEFFAARFREAPDSREGGGETPYEIFRSFTPHPWEIVSAFYDGVRAGVTSVTIRPDGESRVNTFFTGVHPDHRGQGLSTALKALHARLLRDAGWHELLTQNMEINTQILAANDRLGFQRISGYTDLGLAFS